LGPKEEPVIDDSFYVIFNAHHEQLDYTLPGKKYGQKWIPVLDTAKGFVDEGETFKSGEPITVQGRSVVLLKNPKE
jgi:isoamylase